MVKKSAISGDYIINILDSDTVQVLKLCTDSVGSVSGTVDGQNYSLCTNSKGALREIAANVGFEIMENSNTRQIGSKLVDFINAGNADCPLKADNPGELEFDSADEVAEEEQAVSELVQLVTDDILSFIKHQQELMFNERDFQMQLAVAMRKDGKYDDVDVEYFIPNEVAADGGYEWASDLRLDIVVRKDGKYAVVELKYPTKRIESEIHRFGRLLKRKDTNGKDGGTLFEIVKNQGAQDLVRYNFWKDVRRVEIIKALFPESVVGGVAVMLTNDSYYTRSPKPGTLCEAFSTADDEETGEVFQALLQMALCDNVLTYGEVHNHLALAEALDIDQDAAVLMLCDLVKSEPELEVSFEPEEAEDEE